MRRSNRLVFVLLTLFSLGLLAAGLVIGEIKHLNPCHLCNFQRFIYMLLAFLALCGALFPGWRKFWSLLIFIAAASGLWSALEQSWMQYAPQQVAECGFGDPTLVERLVNWLGALWPQMFMVTGFCTSKDWIFLGLSLANWSGVCFLFLSLLALWLFFRHEKSTDWL